MTAAPAPPRSVTEAGARRGGTAGAWLQRWLGFIFFWALLSWWREGPGLIGPHGILPVGDVVQAVGFFAAPSLLRLGPGAWGLRLVTTLGLVASVAAMLRFRPRWALGIGTACFLSLIAVAQVFASYQSDGMLVSAGLLAVFLDAERPSWWTVFALRWEWFAIYFGSGIAKLLSGDAAWRHLTALDQYYQNLPLPNWLGWYAEQHLGHSIEAALAVAIFAIELGVVWLAFGGRRARRICFWIVTPFQVGIILTANYGFLNWLVLGLGFALLIEGQWPRRARAWALAAVPVAYVAITGASLAHRLLPRFPAPARLQSTLAPFRVVDDFGLFAVMTPARYEIEFQGSRDGLTWTAYPFRYKPQDPRRRPVGDWVLFAPYQPRFDWNLWFASLGSYRENPWVEEVEVRLLQNDPAVTRLFAVNPFAGAPPRVVRAVLWQYWFATPAQHRTLGLWWTRRELGLYAPPLAGP